MTCIAGKRMIPMYVNESVYREIKIYAAKTDQTIQVIVAGLSAEFEQSAIKLVTQIREMDRQADIERFRQEEESKLAAEHPLQVSGKTEDPIGQILEPQLST